MRSLALAGIVLLLAGCSLPYEGTSFKGTPRFETAKESEGGEAGAEASKAEGAAAEGYRPDSDGIAPDPAATPTSTPADAQGKDDTYPDVPSTPRTYQKNGPSRASAVFPSTAQPGR